MKKRIVIIGMGPGAKQWLSKEAQEEIDHANILIGSERFIKEYPQKRTVKAVIAEEIAAVIEAEQTENFAVLMSGDTGFYSGTKKLLQKLSKQYCVRVLPGISSVVYFSAKIGIPWEQAELLSLHGKKQNVIPAIRTSEYTFLLTQGNAGAICHRMADLGLGSCEVWIGENLSYEQERIIHDTAEKLADCETETLTVMAVYNPNRQEVPSFGLPDNWFCRGKVPMTKREVRAVIVSRMAVGKWDCVYDIGAGTGSVSVELAMQAIRGTVYAIEQNQEGCDLIRKNSEKFGVDNIEVVQGKAGNVLPQLPVPAAAFIGGSGGELEEIFKILLGKNPDIHVVLTAVTLETLYEAIDLFKKYGFSHTDVVQIAVTRLEERGRYHMMSALNPVFILEGRGNGHGGTKAAD